MRRKRWGHSSLTEELPETPRTTYVYRPFLFHNNDKEIEYDTKREVKSMFDI
jgi:hypothetical protein